MVPMPGGEFRSGTGSVLSGHAFVKIFPRFPPAARITRAKNQTKPPRSLGEAAAIGCRKWDQLLRRLSAARFHWDTLSAIMRVDFMAAWLSWA
jgi:hypothetical protein